VFGVSALRGTGHASCFPWCLVIQPLKRQAKNGQGVEGHWDRVRCIWGTDVHPTPKRTANPLVVNFLLFGAHREGGSGGSVEQDAGSESVWQRIVFEKTLWCWRGKALGWGGGIGDVLSQYAQYVGQAIPLSNESAQGDGGEKVVGGVVATVVQSVIPRRVS